MSLEITVLGSNSAIPAYGRHPSAQILHCKNKLHLIDCGEGTQMRFHDFKIKKNRIDVIFISHLHGDHYFGLIGLLTTYNLLKREKPLHLFAASELMDIIQIQLKSSNIILCYELLFSPIDADKSKMIFENEDITVETLLLNHRIPCVGFLFKEKIHERNLISEKIKEYQIPFTELPSIKNGNDFVDMKGNVIKNSELTIDPPAPHSYAYCSDTLYHEAILPQIKNVDLLYHEATFANESINRANTTFHSTAEQAATIAKKAAVKKLLLGHFSAKYENLELLLNEAKTIFPDSEIAVEGKTYLV